MFSRRSSLLLVFLLMTLPSDIYTKHEIKKSTIWPIPTDPDSPWYIGPVAGCSNVSPWWSCNSHGLCYDNGLGYGCNCYDGWVGSECAIPDPEPNFLKMWYPAQRTMKVEANEASVSFPCGMATADPVTTYDLVWTVEYFTTNKLDETKNATIFKSTVDTKNPKLSKDSRPTYDGSFWNNRRFERGQNGDLVVSDYIGDRVSELCCFITVKPFQYYPYTKTGKSCIKPIYVDFPEDAFTCIVSRLDAKEHTLFITKNEVNEIKSASIKGNGQHNVTVVCRYERVFPRFNLDVYGRVSLERGIELIAVKNRTLAFEQGGRYSMSIHFEVTLEDKVDTRFLARAKGDETQHDVYKKFRFDLRLMPLPSSESELMVRARNDAGRESFGGPVLGNPFGHGIEAGSVWSYVTAGIVGGFSMIVVVIVSVIVMVIQQRKQNAAADDDTKSECGSTGTTSTDC